MKFINGLLHLYKYNLMVYLKQFRSVHIQFRFLGL